MATYTVGTTAVVTSAAETNFLAFAALDATRVLAAWWESSAIKVAVLTVQIPTVVTGPTSDITSVSTAPFCSLTKLEDNKVLLVYIDAGADVQGRVLTVSGNSVTVGSSFLIEAGSFTRCSVTALTATTALAVYAGTTFNSGARAAVLTISGTTGSASGQANFVSSITILTRRVTKIDDDQALVVYKRGSTGNAGTIDAQVLTVTGTTFSAGPATTIFASSTEEVGGQAQHTPTVAIAGRRRNSSPQEELAKGVNIAGDTITAATSETALSEATLASSFDRKVWFEPISASRGLMSYIPGQTGVARDPRAVEYSASGDVASVVTEYTLPPDGDLHPFNVVSAMLSESLLLVGWCSFTSPEGDGKARACPLYVGIPPLRLHPRDDYLAPAGQTPRLFPKPTSRQNSIRRGPNSYW